MAEADVRAQIYDVLVAVDNIGVVHDYERWSADWSAYLDLFKTSIDGQDVIRGWTITCQSFPQEYVQFGGSIQRSYTYKVRGYVALKDSEASEKTAIALTEDVVEALDGDSTLHDDSGDTRFNTGPADLSIFEPRLFGSVLCHYAEITLVIEENV